MTEPFLLSYSLRGALYTRARKVVKVLYTEKFDNKSQALKLALTDGVSRYGPESGRGLGPRPLFRGLANLNSMLRFRSGDHALTIEGQNPVVIPAKLWQKPVIQGLFAAVTCRC